MRWTIRGVEPNVIALVQSVAAESGQTLGAVLTEAIQVWYSTLPDAVDDADLAELQTRLSNIGELIEQLRQLLTQSRANGVPASLSL